MEFEDDDDPRCICGHWEDEHSSGDDGLECDVCPCDLYEYVGD